MGQNNSVPANSYSISVWLTKSQQKEENISCSKVCPGVRNPNSLNRCCNNSIVEIFDWNQLLHTGGFRTEKEDECRLQRISITINKTHPEYYSFRHDIMPVQMNPVVQIARGSLVLRRCMLLFQQYPAQMELCHRLIIQYLVLTSRCYLLDKTKWIVQQNLVNFRYVKLQITLCNRWNFCNIGLYSL